MRTIDRIMLSVAALSWLFWTWYSFQSKNLQSVAIYYALWIGVIGTLLWLRRSDISRIVRNWNLSPFFKFIILGYGAVLLEEIFAALSNNLTEGFAFPLFLIRIGQFWAFNTLAFSGFIIAWYFLIKAFRYSHREIFYLAGIWGIYSEGIYRSVFSNPLAVLFLFAPTILTYGIVITPAILSMPTGERTPVPIFKYILTYVAIFVCSLIPMLILLTLRSHDPFLFPPTKFIP